jgi:cell division protein DivIC
MAAPQRWASARPRPVVPPLARKRADGAVRKKAAGRYRRFVVVVVLPVLLMLGSVYLHTVSAGLSGRVASLEERVAQAQIRGERLEVRVAELSGADRIRPLATKKLGMQDPGGEDLKAYRAER